MFPVADTSAEQPIRPQVNDFSSAQAAESIKWSEQQLKRHKTFKDCSALSL